MRVRKNPLIVLAPLLVIVAVVHFSAPQYRAFTRIALIAGGILLCLNVGAGVLMNLVPTEVPARSLKQLIRACVAESGSTGWKLVEFKPKISLEEVRAKLGEPSYSQERRIANFDFKFKTMSQLHPDVVVFFSKQKGLAAGNVGLIRKLVDKYGQWTIDNWNSFVGAAGSQGMRVQSLDGPQTVPASMLR